MQKKTVHRSLPAAGPDLSGPGGRLVSKKIFLRDVKVLFRTLTRPIVDGRTPNTGGRKFSAQYTRVVDTLLGLLLQRAAHRHGLSADKTGIAVIAMGGYGRAELAPHSDVDVLIVCRRRSREVDAIAASFTRLMWDFGLEPGHAIESLVESEEALAQDIDTKTALIESRWVCGSRRVARGLEKAVARIRRSDRRQYLQRKIHDAQMRYDKFGGSYQLIEPDVKLSPGGMRDYHTLTWLGQIGRVHRGIRTLEQKGLVLRGERAELEAAYDALLRTRIEMHLLSRSRQDVLSVALQRRVATALGYRDRGGHLAVEFFMRELYTHMRAIYRITADCLTDLGHGSRVDVLLGSGRVRRDETTLNLPLRPERLQKNPLHVFATQKQTGRRLSRALRRRLVDNLQGPLRGAPVVRRMRREFLDLVADDRNVALVVRSLHDTRLLMRIVPEFEQLTCLKRYDLYHHYTVDEHSFQVLEYIAALGAPGADPADPFVRIYSEIDGRRALFLAALLHDVGKISGRGHARKGAELARRILKRMGTPAEETAFVGRLIEHHLVMSHYSQRRDPSDLGTIEAFCRVVRNRRTLKYLCLLTYADYRATSPDVWNEWKRSLLWDLYLRAYDFMARSEKKPEAVYKRHKHRLLQSYRDPHERARALAHLDLLPGGYLLTMTSAMVRRHMRMVDEVTAAEPCVEHRAYGDTIRITIVAHDSPALLAQMCGALAINNFTILHAYAFTRKDAIAIDVFDCALIQTVAEDGDLERAVSEVGRTLADVSRGRVNLMTGVDAHARRWRRIRRSTIPVDIKVRFENDISDDFTIVDIFAADRPGLLFYITDAFSREGLIVYRANISTEANRAIDSFYVTNRRGEKIADARLLRKLRDAIRRSLVQSRDRESTAS